MRAQSTYVGSSHRQLISHFCQQQWRALTPPVAEAAAAAAEAGARDEAAEGAEAAGLVIALKTNSTARRRKT